jgi:hypothetical protein
MKNGVLFLPLQKSSIGQYSEPHEEVSIPLFENQVKYYPSVYDRVFREKKNLH